MPCDPPNHPEPVTSKDVPKPQLALSTAELPNAFEEPASSGFFGYGV